MKYTPAQQAALDAAAQLADRDCTFSQEQIRRVAVALMRVDIRNLRTRATMLRVAAQLEREANALEANHG